MSVNQAQVTQWILDWLGRVTERMGVRPMVYTSPNGWLNRTGDTSAVAQAGYTVLWVAHWGGGKVSRFTPTGQLDRTIPLPASQITNCVFAGAELDRMFVTSAATGKPDEALAGSLFEVDSQGARGLAPYYFGG